jgi:tyrosyl-tRNA synthetase
MFAKTMSIPDDLMREWFELLTDRSPDEITTLLAGNPMQAKKTLGKDIASSYYGSQAAEAAAAEWSRRFSQRQDPTEIPEVAIPAAELTDGKMWICKLLVSLGLTRSNNEARQLAKHGGVTIGPERDKITDPTATIAVTDGLIVRAGKLQVVRVRLK